MVVVVVVQTYIRFSLEPDDVIFAILNWPNSVFSSVNCFARSSLFFAQRVPALTFAVDW